MRSCSRDEIVDLLRPLNLRLTQYDSVRPLVATDRGDALQARMPEDRVALMNFANGLVPAFGSRGILVFNSFNGMEEEELVALVQLCGAPPPFTVIPGPYLQYEAPTPSVLFMLSYLLLSLETHAEAVPLDGADRWLSFQDGFLYRPSMTMLA